MVRGSNFASSIFFLPALEGSTLKGKNLLLWEQIPFFNSRSPFEFRDTLITADFERDLLAGETKRKLHKSCSPLYIWWQKKHDNIPITP